MKRGAKLHFSTQPFLERPPKMRSQLTILIRYDGQQDPMNIINIIDVDPCIILYRISRLNKDKVCGFFNSIHYNPNWVILPLGSRQFKNNVNINFFPLHSRNTISWITILGFRYLAFTYWKFGLWDTKSAMSHFKSSDQL